MNQGNLEKTAIAVNASGSYHQDKWCIPTKAEIKERAKTGPVSNVTKYEGVMTQRPGCIAGHACTLIEGFQGFASRVGASYSSKSQIGWTYCVVDGEMIKIEKAARAFLGLTQEQAGELFEEKRATKEEAVAMLVELLETRTVDWNAVAHRNAQETQERVAQYDGGR